MTNSGPHGHRRATALIACMLALGGCALNTKPQKSAVMTSTKISGSVEGVRAAVLAQSQDAAEGIERTADTIAAQATSPQVRTNAIQWKLVSTVELDNAALSRDPIVALGELVLFALQSRAYLTTGEGRTLFGSQQPQAVAAVDQILAALLQYIGKISPPGATERWLSVLQPWADANPIRSPYVGRTSSLTDSITNLIVSDNTALATVGDIEVTARLLDTRVAQIQQSLLKQARWQAELILADAAKQPVVDTLVRDVGRLTTSVETITGVTEGLPGLVTSERIAALLAITNERIAVLQAIAEERQALLEGLSAERVAVVNALHEERIATLKDAELASQRLIDYTLDQRLELVINHVLWRVFLGLALLLLLALGAGLVLVAFARRSGRLART